tara:strand:+ start:97 stop:294 length:198 start_codon:yes stop_codon:yes gene_type:complete
MLNFLRAFASVLIKNITVVECIFYVEKQKVENRDESNSVGKEYGFTPRLPTLNYGKAILVTGNTF